MVYLAQSGADLGLRLKAQTEARLVGFVGLAPPLNSFVAQPVTDFSGPRWLTCENVILPVVLSLVIKIT